MTRKMLMVGTRINGVTKVKVSQEGKGQDKNSRPSSFKPKTDLMDYAAGPEDIPILVTVHPDADRLNWNR